MDLLKTFLETNLSVQEIAEKFTSLGHEVEEVDDPAAYLKDFKVAKIDACIKHPDADRLNVCTVDIGEDEPKTIVCGAPNARAGIFVVFADIGTTIPSNQMVLKKGKIRGVESCGMLCSAKELNLSDESEGIFELPNQPKPGTSLIDVIKTDTTFDLAITPNRGDCFSVYGLARDLAAAGYGTLKPLNFVAPKSLQNLVAPKISILSQLCEYFTVQPIVEINNAVMSPEWLYRAIQSTGHDPISPLVDVTNYFCHSYGRPMHVYDAEKIVGDITIRMAEAGETMEGLNDITYTLTPEMLVVADNAGPIAIAGILGGKRTAVNANTTQVLLETALFNAVSIAQTGQQLNLTTDARQRFERGVDANIIDSCLSSATEKILNICGGQAGNPIRVGQLPPQTTTINFSLEGLKKRVGINLQQQEVDTILANLGCKKDGQHYLPPSWRHDLTIAEDLYEEVARIHGYDNIQPISLPLKPSVSQEGLDRYLRKQLKFQGFLECYTWSFISEFQVENFSLPQEQLISISNPISQDLKIMRPSLLPSLFDVAIKNMRRGILRGNFFEYAKIFNKNLPQLEANVLSALSYGENTVRNWQEKTKPVDFYTVKSQIFQLLAAMNLKPEKMQLAAEAPSYYHPGRSAVLKQGKLVIANFGELHPSIANEFPTVAFEIFIDHLKIKPQKKQPLGLSDQMPLQRDFCFIMDEKLPAADLLKAIQGVSSLISEVNVFDVYQGGNMEKGKKSIALCAFLQPQEKSLSESELQDFQQRVIAAAEKIGATLR